MQLTHEECNTCEIFASDLYCGLVCSELYLHLAKHITIACFGFYTEYNYRIIDMVDFKQIFPVIMEECCIIIIKTIFVNFLITSSLDFQQKRVDSHLRRFIAFCVVLPSCLH